MSSTTLETLANAGAANNAATNAVRASAFDENPADIDLLLCPSKSEAPHGPGRTGVATSWPRCDLPSARGAVGRAADHAIGGMRPAGCNGTRPAPHERSRGLTRSLGGGSDKTRGYFRVTAAL